MSIAKANIFSFHSTDLDDAVVNDSSNGTPAYTTMAYP